MSIWTLGLYSGTKKDAKLIVEQSNINDNAGAGVLTELTHKCGKIKDYRTTDKFEKGW